MPLGKSQLPSVFVKLTLTSILTVRDKSLRCGSMTILANIKGAQCGSQLHVQDLTERDLSGLLTSKSITFNPRLTGYFYGEIDFGGSYLRNYRTGLNNANGI